MRARSGGAVLSAILLAAARSAPAQPPAAQPPATQPPARPTPPTRDPRTPEFVAATELPDGAVPPADADGDFVIGPTHAPAPELAAPDVPRGTVHVFTMRSADSRLF